MPDSQPPEEADVPQIKDVSPADERRALGRLDVRIGEGISVFLRFSDTSPTLEFSVIDFSAIGLGVESRGDDFRPEQARPGEDVAAIFRTSRRNLRGLPLRCRIIDAPRAGPGGRWRFGLEVLPFRTQKKIEDDIGLRTIPISLRPALVGLMKDPFQYDQTSLVSVLRISRNYMVLRNSDPVFAIFPYQQIEFHLNLFSSNDPIRAQVIYVRRVGNRIHFAVQIDAMSADTDRAIVRYIMRFLKWPPFILRRVGFDTSNIKNIIQFRFVKTQADYVAVLKLRRMAYAAARKLKRDTNLSRLYSEYDEFSRILTAWHQDLLVGSVAMRFGDGRKAKFEFQEQLGDGQFQRKLPRPEEIIEVSRLCMHHDYRKTDILMGMFERVFQVLVTSGRSYLVAACDKYLWPIYESIGFRKTGLYYTVQREVAVRLDVIMVNKRVGTYGAEFDPMRWNEMYRGIAEHLDSAGLIEKSPRHVLVSPAHRMYIDAVHLSQELQKEFHDLQKTLVDTQVRLEEEMRSLSQDIRNPQFIWGVLNYFLDHSIRFVRSIGNPRESDESGEDA